MNDELKPCPFCGQEATLKENYPAGGMGMLGFFVRCLNCGAEGAFDLGKSGAIESWSTRPIEDALREQVKQLTAERDALLNFVKPLTDVWNNKEDDVYNGLAGKELK